MRQAKGSRDAGRTNSPTYPFLQLIQQFQVATRSTSPDMTAVFHTWPYILRFHTYLDSKPFTKMFLSWLLNKGKTEYLHNLCHATGLFLYSLKTSQKQRFSVVFRGYRKKQMTWNRLSTCP